MLKCFELWGQKVMYPSYDQSFTLTSGFVAFYWEIQGMCFNRYIHNSLQKDQLLVKVNKLTSTKTQLPYSYYSLPFCKPDTIVDSAENLGEVLRGDRIENSPYVVSTSLLLVMCSPYQLWCTKSLSVVYSVVWAVVWDEGAQDVPDCLQSINWW